MIRLTRRAFGRTLGASGLAALAAARPAAQARPRVADALRLSSNENSYGPGDRVLEAVREALAQANRYPFASAGRVTGALARQLGVSRSQVALACGSSEVLDVAVTAFTDQRRGVVSAVPTFEAVAGRGRELGRPVVEVPLGADHRLDLDAMAARSAGAGLVYVCNPNNPTGTIHAGKAVAAFVDRVLAATPGATVLVDEAYHEYVLSPDYQSAIALAVSRPGVVVSRTFSKIYGMAGLRVGYAVGHPETLARMRPYLGGLTMSHTSATAALAALSDPARVEEQRRLTAEARAFTVQCFTDLGCRVIPSEANFVMADVRRDVRLFQDDCRSRGLQIARPFPPLDTFARVTIGTMDEMRRAAGILRDVLAAPSARVGRLVPMPAPDLLIGRGYGC